MTEQMIRSEAVPSETWEQFVDENYGWLFAGNPRMIPAASIGAHWLVNSDTGWACSGCDWTGAILKDYWTAHEKLDEYQVPF